MPNVLAVLEQRDGTLRKVSHEVVSAARRLAGGLGGGVGEGGGVDAVLLAAGPVAGAETLGASGADRVLSAVHPTFGLYNPDGYAATVASLGGAYSAIVFAATAQGKDLAPRVAAKVGVPCATDVTDLDLDGGKVTVTRPVYAGKALQRLVLTASPALLSIRPNTFPPLGEKGKGKGEKVDLDVPAFSQRVAVTEVKAPAQAALDVSEATIVVSGGRGLKDPANFKLIEELAAAFGSAAVGASRAVVDAGWREHSAQVGQTGKTVSPTLYLAVGISGAIQHLAGMRTSKVIVAINKDRDAPIFKVADYGIVGDLFEVVPRLTEEIRKLKAEH
jgi:electron transfer flavoprotein alpha subunit